MIGWHQDMSEKTRNSEGQGILLCCSPWDPTEVDMTTAKVVPQAEWNVPLPPVGICWF